MRKLKLKVKMCGCGKRSVPGLIAGIALCQLHFDDLVHHIGTEQDRKDAIARLHKSPVKLKEVQ